MKIKQLISKALIGTLAIAMLMTPNVAKAEEVHSSDYNFTVECFYTENGKVRTGFNEMFKSYKTTLTVTDDPLYVTDFAPVVAGYKVVYCHYRYGRGNNLSYARELQYAPTIHATTKEIVNYMPRVIPYDSTYTTMGNYQKTQAMIDSDRECVIQLYYSPIDYTVNYVAEDAENVPTDDSVYAYNKNVTVSDVTPEKEGFSFVGWSYNDQLYVAGDKINTTSVPVAYSISDLRNQQSATASEDITLTAVFEEIPVPVEVAPTLTITTDEVSSWGDNAQINVTVKNETDSVIKSWKAALDINAEIQQIWCADIASTTATGYVIGCPAWKQNLEAGESYTFGIIVKKLEDEVNAGNGSVTTSEVEVATDDYTASLTKTGAWAYGFNGDITIANNTDASIDNWTIEFDYADEINNMWNATVVSHEGTHYVVENAGHNSTIYANGTVSFGFSGSPSDGEYSEETITNVVLKAIK